jgi:hypothetical protein
MVPCLQGSALEKGSRGEEEEEEEEEEIRSLGLHGRGGRRYGLVAGGGRRLQEADGM